jgi:hypothetical protein
MNEIKYYYFAYGGNTNNNHMTTSYPNSKFFSIGLLYNYKLAFRKSLNNLNLENAYCDIDYQENKTVYGIIYELSLDDINKLDDQEYNGILYKRISIDIQLLNHQIIKCYTYIMINKDMPYSKPNDRYYKVVIDGYNYHNLPLSQIYNAINEINL